MEPDVYTYTYKITVEHPLDRKGLLTVLVTRVNVNYSYIEAIKAHERSGTDTTLNGVEYHIPAHRILCFEFRGYKR